MKKAILIILAAFLFVSGTISCTVVQKGDYRYADHCNIDITALPDEVFWNEIYEHSEEAGLQDVLAILEDSFELYFQDLDFDWDNLRALDTARVVLVNDREELQKLSVTTLESLQRDHALYDSKNNAIFLLPKFVSADSTMQVYILVHELVHAALASKTTPHIEEGLADYYASVYMRRAGMEVSGFAYPQEMVVTMWLFSVYGEKEVIQAVRTGEIYSLLDNSTKPGMGKKLDDALIYLYSGDQKDSRGRTAAANTVYDILAHATIQAEKADEVEYLYETAKIVCDTIGIEIDTKYFDNMLSRKKV
ncbi:hypothetical protein IKT18_03070 [Candidatus Saccharibacteria bacterium]|nr:hypothetical protein [Candidatus Saccharibacteria bacterium]